MNLAGGFRLGHYDIRPQENVIGGPNGDVRIEPKSMDVLLNLALAGGRTVPREELVEAVWPGRYVSEDVLTRCVAQIRKALGDPARSPQFLVTIRKRGYRLARPVAPPGAGRARPDLSGYPGIVVLPFQNLSGDPADRFVADGLTELITASLATTGGLRVISRTTAMELTGTGQLLPEIADRLHVDWVVEGSVIIDKTRIQVVMQLISAPDDNHVLAENYHGGMADLLRLQNEIANDIARRIGIALGIRIAKARLADLTVSEDGMRAYLKGLCFQSRRTAGALRNAVDSFTETIRLDPEYPDGYANRAESLKMLVHYGAEPVEGTLPGIYADLDHALTIDPDNANALACRGGVRFSFERDLDAAESELRRAHALLPGNPITCLMLANLCAVRCNFPDAAHWMNQATLVSPLDLGLNMNLGDHSILRRDYAVAVRQLRRALEIDATHWPSQLRLAWALGLNGEHAAAAAELGLARNAIGDTPAFHEYSAVVAGLAEQPVRAAKHLRQLESLADNSYVTPWAMARAAVAAGEFEQAFDCLDRALAGRASSIVFFNITPAFDNLRRLPRGRELQARLKLPVIEQAC